MHTQKEQSLRKGFTLLELLIVIAILAVLATVAILTLNPAETLREARDSNRISDLSTLKTAIAIYITSTSSPVIDSSSNNTCTGGTGTRSVYYSLSSATSITDGTVDTNASGSQVSAANLYKVDGSGWLRINFAQLGAGSPVGNLPIDPTNTISNLGAVATTDLVYRYGCRKSNLTFEVDANLESSQYSTKEGTDGGDNSGVYEVGSDLTILGTGTDF